MKRIRIDHRRGVILYTIRNKGCGTLTFTKPLEKSCHVCPTNVGPLMRCRHCGFLACPDHYNTQYQVCSDCLCYYRHAEVPT